MNEVRVCPWVEVRARLFGETCHEGLGRHRTRADVFTTELLQDTSRRLKRSYLPRDG